MNITDILLNNIYCMSLDAARTASIMKSHPLNSSNFLSYKLHSLLTEVNSKTLELYRELTMNLPEEKLYRRVSEILLMGSDIENTYEGFLETTKLSKSHTLMKKLKAQVDNILLMLTILSQTVAKNKDLNHENLINQQS